MKLFRYLYDTRIIALLLSIPFLFILPVKEKKFRAELIPSGPRSPAPRGTIFVDLNGDGISEKIYYFENSYGMLAFQVYDLDEGLYDQWNFPRKYHHNAANVWTGDIDKNGFSEVIGFTVNYDSVFINYCEPLGPDPGRMTTIFAATIDRRKGYETDFSVTDAALTDMNGDSYDDLVFVIHAGYSLQPRKIYIYNFRDGVLKESNAAGNVLNRLNFANLDDDPMPEIYGGQQSEFNIPDDSDIPYSDRNPWLMVYDNDLSYLFPHGSFPETYARLETSHFQRNGSRVLISWYHPFRLDTIKSFLLVTDTEGKRIEADTLEDFPPDNHYSFFKLDDEHFLLITPGGRIIRFNSNLERLKETDTGIPAGDPKLIRDLNGDGKAEVILPARDYGKLYIISGNLRNVTSTVIPGGGSPFFLKSSPDSTSLRMLINNQEFTLKYDINPFFYLRFPLLLMIYFIFFAVVHLIKKIQEKRLSEQYALETQMRTLELNAFRSQMDPHFTFNVFNIVASLLNKGNREQAMDAFLKFSNLIRQNLEKYDNITRTLREEIEITVSFLELTRLRYPEFNYQIDREESASLDIIIPKMIILTHVENAVKHGLGPRGGRGKILISVNEHSGFLHILVEDNGVGRGTGSGSEGSSTGLGLSILEKLIGHINRSSARKLTQSFSDLKDASGMTAGTRVEIRIPY